MFPSLLFFAFMDLYWTEKDFLVVLSCTTKSMSCNVGNSDKTWKNHHNRSGKSLWQGLGRRCHPHPWRVLQLDCMRPWVTRHNCNSALMEWVWATFLQQYLPPKVFCDCPVVSPHSLCCTVGCTVPPALWTCSLLKWEGNKWITLLTHFILKIHLYNHMIGYFGMTPSRSTHDWAGITQIYTPNEVTQSGWGN